MNHKRQQFINEYLLSGNATEAAIKAGFSQKTAYSQGQRLLKNVEIQEAIQKRQAIAQDESQVKLINVVREINRLAFQGETDGARLKALDMLMKHLGGYNDHLKLVSMLSDEQLESLAKRILNDFE